MSPNQESLNIGGGGGNGFGTVQPPAGTTPTATIPADTLNITTTDGTIVATGNAGTKSIDLKIGTFVASNLPVPGLSAIGAILAAGPTTSNWINAISISGIPLFSQPGFSNISGTVASAQLAASAASLIGGILSIGATTSRWINAISTAGVPGLAQPAFTDISGTAASAQLPASGASLIGGVLSFGATTSRWVNSLSTAGVHGLAQPAFTDISGVATGAQIPAPGVSLIGGILQIGASTSNWVSAISSSGVPVLSQPAFTDISGTAVNTQVAGFSNSIYLNKMNAYGTTCNRAWRWTNSQVNGVGLTLTQSTTDADSITVLVGGMYAVGGTVEYSAAGFYALTNGYTTISSATLSPAAGQTQLVLDITKSANFPCSCTWMGRLAVNNVLRLTGDGTTVGANPGVGQFWVCQIGN